MWPVTVIASWRRNLLLSKRGIVVLTARMDEQRRERRIEPIGGDGAGTPGAGEGRAGAEKDTERGPIWGGLHRDLLPWQSNSSWIQP
jgi:hypothetical protein